MAILTLEEMREDRLIMSVARALALAKEAAIAHGTDPDNSLVTISEEPSQSGQHWRIHYGPRDYVGRRGGDLIVVVDEQAGVVERTLRGQ